MSVSGDPWQIAWCFLEDRRENLKLSVDGSREQAMLRNNDRPYPASGAWKPHHYFRKTRVKWAPTKYLPASFLSAWNSTWIRWFCLCFYLFINFFCAAITHYQHFQVIGRNSEVMKRFVEHNLELLYRKNFTDWWTRQKGWRIEKTERRNSEKWLLSGVGQHLTF